MNSLFPIADGTAKLSGRDHEFRESTLRWEPTVRSEDLSGEIQGESGESQPADPTDDAEARADFWSIQGDFIYRHHNEPRVELCVPKKEQIMCGQKFGRKLVIPLRIVRNRNVQKRNRIDNARGLR